MTRSMISRLALGALVAGALSLGAAQAQTMQQKSTAGGTQTYGRTPLGAPQGATGTPAGTTTGTSSGMSATGAPATAGNVGPGIGPGTLGGVGPPTDGLDSNPYAEAPAHTRKALGVEARGKQSASKPRPTKTKSGSTLN